ncbi:hypothetical protein MHH52_20695 [Paenibacillus sp. FSL K6-0276]|uniref:hypothetical protein n=1 Tax=Paenibacillus sp. FSL K6-0276 TaxID=2921450 RepID=UPI0030EB3564
MQFAKLFKDRDNKTPEEIAVAKVINIMPNIKLSLGTDIIFDADNLVNSSRIYELIYMLATMLLLCQQQADRYIIYLIK